MASLVQYGKYGAINTSHTAKNRFYVIMFISEAHTLKNNTTIDGQIISTGELVFKAQYLCSMQVNTNWYLEQQSLQQTIIVKTRTIMYPCLDVVVITDVEDIPKNDCNRIQAKKIIQGHPICITDTGYDHILDEIKRRYKIDLKKTISGNSDEEYYVCNIL